MQKNKLFPGNKKNTTFRAGKRWGQNVVWKLELYLETDPCVKMKLEKSFKKKLKGGIIWGESEVKFRCTEP